MKPRFPMKRAVAQTFQSAGSGDFPVARADCGVGQRVSPVSAPACAMDRRDPCPASWVREDTGFVLAGVLVVVLLLSMIALSLMFHLRAEETANEAGAGGEQAWDAAMSGVHEAMRVAGQTAAGDLDWQDNAAAFRERLVIDDGSERWYFSVFTKDDSDSTAVRFGIVDEASKLNVNTATESMLGKLPKMTPYLVQGLLDFLDGDGMPRPEGAEQEYYDALPQPYGVYNRWLSTLDELLLVRGLTPAVLFGENSIRNSPTRVNAGEDDFPLSPAGSYVRSEPGIGQLLTVASCDSNEDNARARRIDLNDPKVPLPENDFPPALIQYVAALRRNKVTLNHAADLLEAKGKFKDDKGAEVELASGVGKAELTDVLDRLTATALDRLPGLINVNTASSEVLQTIPEIDEPLADLIVSTRRHLRAEQRRTPAWLYEEALVNADRFKKVAPYLTSRGCQFRFQAIGYGLPSGRFRVLEAIIDLAGPKPGISYLRDLTRLGLPFKLNTTPQEETVASHARHGRAQNLAGKPSCLPLTPSFSWVFAPRDVNNRFNGFGQPIKTVETVITAERPSNTHLKQGVNEKDVASRGIIGFEASQLAAALFARGGNR
ncbi:MAG: hypothetical protein FJ403_16875 [Verrucomicrobia bacterium]|nr:hypothetical protein [Verrucomicrobiota bacterium]